jgi:hypothetical protein
MLNEEEKFGIKNFKTYQNFGKKVYKIKENVIKNINDLKKIRKINCIWSSCKSNNCFKFFWYKNQIDFIVEDNKLKHNKFIPGVNIPIYFLKKNYIKIKIKD